MEKFAKFIKNYLDNNNITFSNAAKLCDIDRTVLSRYASGKRKPRNRESVIKIADGLNMPPEDRKSLLEIYDIGNECMKYNKSFVVLSDILRKGIYRYSASSNDGVVDCEFHEESSSILKSVDEIISALNYLLKGVQSVKMNINTKVLCNCMELCDLVNRAAKNSNIEHVTGISSKEWQNSSEGVETLRYMLPLMFNSTKYTMLYSYHEDDEGNCGSRDMYYVLTERGVVLFDTELTEGFFSNQQVSVKYYSGLFDSVKLKCRVFVESDNTWDETRIVADNLIGIEDDDTGISMWCDEGHTGVWIMNRKNNRVVSVKEISLGLLIYSYIKMA